jgi:hypothetical protein
VVDKLIDIVIAWDPSVIAIDSRSAAAVIEPTLKAADVEPHMAATTEVVLAAGSFLDVCEAGSLSHSNQAPLTDGAVSATKRPLGAGFAWDHAAGVTYLNAASLAHWALLSATTAAPKRSLPPMAADTGSSGGYREPAFLDLDKVRF